MNKHMKSVANPHPQTIPKCARQLSFKMINLKVDHGTGGKWFVHGTKHREENQLVLVM